MCRTALVGLLAWNTRPQSNVAHFHILQAVDGEILNEYPHVKSWFERCRKQIDHYDELNGSGAQLFGQMIKSALKI